MKNDQKKEKLATRMVAGILGALFLSQCWIPPYILGHTFPALSASGMIIFASWIFLYASINGRYPFQVLKKSTFWF